MVTNAEVARRAADILDAHETPCHGAAVCAVVSLRMAGDPDRLPLDDYPEASDVEHRFAAYLGVPEGADPVRGIFRWFSNATSRKEAVQALRRFATSHAKEPFITAP